MYSIVESEPHLVFSQEGSRTLVVYATSSKWAACFQNTPDFEFTASEEGILAYLQLLFLSCQAPFDNNRRWVMDYKIGKTVISNTGRCIHPNLDPKIAEPCASIFMRIAKSGLALLNCSAKMDRKSDQKTDGSWSGLHFDKEGSNWHVD